MTRTSPYADDADRRLYRMARAAGYELVRLDEHREHLLAQESLSAVCIHEARRMRAALLRIGVTLAETTTTVDQLADQVIAAIAIVEEALDPGKPIVVPPGADVEELVRRLHRVIQHPRPLELVADPPAEAIVDTSPGVTA